MALPKDSSKSTGIRNSYGEYVENSYNPVTERQIGKGSEETLHQKNIQKVKMQMEGGHHRCPPRKCKAELQTYTPSHP